MLLVKGTEMNLFPSIRKIIPLRVLTVIGASVSLLAGCSRDPKIAADQPIPVQLSAPHSLHEPASVSASGSVEANVTALTAFQIGGRVAQVFVDDGDYVKQGTARRLRISRRCRLMLRRSSPSSLNMEADRLMLANLAHL